MCLRIAAKRSSRGTAVATGVRSPASTRREHPRRWPPGTRTARRLRWRDDGWMDPSVNSSPVVSGLARPRTAPRPSGDRHLGWIPSGRACLDGRGLSFDRPRPIAGVPACERTYIPRGNSGRRRVDDLVAEVQPAGRVEVWWQAHDARPPSAAMARVFCEIPDVDVGSQGSRRFAGRSRFGGWRWRTRFPFSCVGQPVTTVATTARISGSAKRPGLRAKE
jgi:hypothetical protein